MRRVVKLGRSDIPAIDLVKGMHTRFNVCHETVASEALRMGVCHHDADMADLKWAATSEEAFYIAKGSVKVAWENDAGEKGEAIVREGEQIYLPSGFRYTLSSNGEPAINVFALGGNSTSLTNDLGQEHANAVKSAAAALAGR